MFADKHISAWRRLSAKDILSHFIQFIAFNRGFFLIPGSDLGHGGNCLYYY